MWGRLLAAGVVAAAVFPAAVAFMAVVVAVGGGVAGQGAVQQGLDGGVGRARHPAVKADAGRCQGGLGAAADAAADQGCLLYTSDAADD